MTAVLCYASEKLSIILSDTRVSYGKNPLEDGYKDDQEKLISIPRMGWTAGAGLADLIDTFKYTLKSINVDRTTDIQYLLKKTIEMIENDQPNLLSDAQNSILAVSWSYIEEESNKTCVGLFSGQFNDEVYMVGNETIQAIYPTEYLNNTMLIEKLMKKHEFNVKYENNLAEIIAKMLLIFLDITQECNSVSNNCDIGIVRIYENEFYKFKLSGNSLELLQGIMDNSLNELMESVFD